MTEEATLNTLEEYLGVIFKQRHLLVQALTHRSYANEQVEKIENNERLEFLGDAILDFIVADDLYMRYEHMPEGQLTRLRSELVRTETLAQLARTCHVGEFLRMGRGEENTGGRERDTNLCGAFEAIVGALYLDQGLETVKTFALPHLQKLHVQVMQEAIQKDARSQLQEWIQANLSITPAYRLQSSTGPEHSKQFHVGVLVGERIIAEGTGKSKQNAAHNAAKNALEGIRSGAIVFDVQRTKEPKEVDKKDENTEQDE